MTRPRVVDDNEPNTVQATKLFGTDGIRGAAGAFPLDDSTITRVGHAVATVLGIDGRAPRVLIGRDTRESGPAIETALSRGLTAVGAEVVSGGILSTPAVAHLTRSCAFDAGVVISASHNAYRDNGLKVFSSEGYKLSDDLEREVERLVDTDHSADGDPAEAPAPRVGGTDLELKRSYLEAVRVALGPSFSLGGQRIVVDCANGAASELAPELLAELGADVVALATKPDGRNINEDCGALHAETLAAEVVKQGAFLGAAYDGDADRCILVDETGTVCDGDDVLAIAARALQSRGQLGGDEVVSTVMANLGLEKYIQSIGLGFIRTGVGDRQVLDDMLKRGALLGGEQSGHILFLEHATTGDGLLTSLLIGQMILLSGQPLSRLRAHWTRLPQTLKNVRVREKVDLATVPAVQRAIVDTEAALDGTGRLLVRYSGTEPLLRIMLEGESLDQIEGMADQIADVVESALG